MTTRLAITRLLAGVGLTLAIGACSGSTAAPATSAPIGAGGPASAAASTSTTPAVPAASADAAGGGDDAAPGCALVTKDDVATAVGYSIATATGAGGACIYQNADPSKYFAVQLFDTAGGMAPYLSVEDSSQHVTGLGDDAFWQGAAGFLFVRQGSRAILFLNQEWVLTPDTDTTHRDSLVTLARAALKNL